ncbi:MAG: phosphopyruvate hydratase [Candidatus Nealsonbacteria bacterium]|nr:phosphopyruvate hydratase [Candidatus Nealsonbacteria bacterium]
MSVSKIKSIRAREILDSRGYPTVEVELKTDLGVFVASSPAGTSVGKHEAKELRDKGDKYLGLGVSKAVNNVNKIITPALKNKDVQKQEKIDELMKSLDGTKDKSKLGANAILAVSMAVSRAGAASAKMPLWQWISKLAGTTPLMPIPCLLYIEGGKHGRGDLDVQEFMVVLEESSFEEQLRMGTESYHALREIIIKKFGRGAANVGLEGGFTPPLQETSDALSLITTALKKTKSKAKFIIDSAASTFYKGDKYYFEGEIFNREQLLSFYQHLCQKYPIVAIEDPFSEDDWPGFQKITQTIGQNVGIIGDDLLATNISRIKESQKKGACNGLILKPNQAGTVSETISAGKLALDNNMEVFVKHRSGETCDSFISDLSVGLGNGWIMAGAPQRGERVAKYNRLLRISQELK